MTTIKLKNGSGAPTAGDLAQGEPALDLTNKRLYTEDSGGTVIEVGTNPGEDVTFADNRKAIFGAGSDLQIYHDGGNSRIYDQGTGALVMRSNQLNIQSPTGEKLALFNQNSDVELYYDDSLKLATTSTGIDVTGVITTDGMTTSADINFGDNDKAVFGAGNDLEIYHDGTTSIIKDAGTGELQLHAENNLRLQNLTGSTYALFSNGAAASLYYNGLGKLATTNTGIDVTGTVTADGLTVTSGSSSDNIMQVFGGGTIYAGLGVDGTGAILTAGSSGSADSDLIIKTSSSGTEKQRARFQDNGDISFYEDTGTTAKLFWDASAESLLIGQSTIPTGLGASNTKLILGNFADAPEFVAYNSVNVLAEGDKIGAYLFGNDDNNATEDHFAGMWAKSSGTGGHMDIHFAGGRDNYENDSPHMTIDSSGNVGIGTDSPDSQSGYGGLSINGTSGGILTFMDDDVKKASIQNAANDFYIQSGAQTIFRNGGFTSGDEAMRIDSSGNLLVGTTSTPLSIIGSGTGDAFGYSGNDGYLAISRDFDGAALYLNKTNGQGGSHIQFRADGSTVGSIGTRGSDVYLASTTQGVRPLDAASAFVPTDNVGAGNDASVDLGTTSSGTIRWRNLYLSGRVVAHGVTTSAEAWSSQSDSTSSSVHLYFRNPNGFVGNISTSGTATAYNTSSDYRLKENVVAMSGATERLKQLAPKRFNFIADADTTVDGFLAHEVADVVPEAVTGAKDAVDDDGNAVYQGIDQSKLVPLLVATIQELEARIAALESN